MSRAQPTLNQLNIVSRDLAASIAFYRQLGVDIPDERVWQTPTGAHHANAEGAAVAQGLYLDLDSATFAQVWNTGWRGRADLAGRVVVGFRVATRPAVDQIYGEMTAAGYRGLQEPHDAFWGARYAIIEDPDGIAVCLMSPITDNHRSPPPEV